MNMSKLPKLIFPALFIIFTLALLNSNAFDRSFTPRTAHNSCPSLYPTPYIPTAIRIIDDDTIYIQEPGALTEFHISSRHAENVFLSNDPIIDFLPSDKYTLILTQSTNTQNLIQLDTMTQTSRQIAEFPLSSITAFGQDQLCVTTIQSISSPDQIATRILIYRLDTTGEPVPTADLSTSLTIIPVHCGSTLFLATPFPIAPAYYRWDPDSDEPQKIPGTDSNDLSVPQEIATTTGNSSTAILEGRVLMIYPGTRSESVTTEPDTSDSVTNESIITHSVTTKSFTIPSTRDTFTEVTIIGKDTFALISDIGQLWILECKPKPAFGLGNLFFERGNLELEHVIPLTDF
jgi:hypothetical protein